MKWEKKVAELLLLPLTHREQVAASAPEVLSMYLKATQVETPGLPFYCLRPLVSVFTVRDLWSPFYVVRFVEAEPPQI